MIRYGIPSAANAFLLALVYDLDYIFVGRTLGAVELGRYTMAFRIPQALIVTAFYALSTVAFPVLVRIAQDRPRMAAAYVGWMRIQLLYGLVSGVTLALLAPNLVPLILGDDWITIVPALQALALYASLRSLSSGAFDLYKAVGRPTLALGLSVVRLGAVVPMLFLTVDDGIAAVAWGQVVVAGVLVCIMQAVACRVLGLGAGAFARAMLAPIAVAFVVGAAILGARAVIPGAGLGSTALVLGVAVGVGAIGVRVLAPDLARQLRRFLATAFDAIRPTRRAGSVVAPGSET